MKGKTILISVLFVFILSGFVAAQNRGKQIGSKLVESETLNAKVDKLFAQWNRSDSPGCALAIIKDGKIIYKQGYGIANLDYNVPITPATVFDIGSMTKQFTAACIVLLAEKGQISLDDDIRKYIPEIPDYGNTVTIRHLIHHTSGIRDYPWLMVLARMPFEDVYEDKDQEILNLIARQHNLSFRPGDEYYYSNSNYFLLANIVKRVTGMSLVKYAAQEIFEPLGMRNTFLNDDPARIVKNRAVGYVPDKDGGYHIKQGWTPIGPGGINSTVEDLFLWDQNFYNNKIDGQDFNKVMLTRGKLNNGNTINHAFGLDIDEYRGLKTVGFGGYTEGFVTYMMRFPEQNFTVICLANMGNMHPEELCFQVADLYLAGKLKPIEPKPEPAKRTEVSVDPAIFDNYVGAYLFDFGLLMNVTKENDRLMMQGGKQPKVELFPESETKFFLKVADAQVSFRGGKNGKALELILHQRGQELVAKRVESQSIQPMSPDQLAEFAGEYYSDELQVTYKVLFDKGQLFVKAPRSPDDPLRHLQGDEFVMSRGNMIFSRNGQGKITDFTLEIKTEWLSIKFSKK